ncbi:selenide, water dikinase SelD [Maritimibacter sp. 55A14]|uniref:selenide, water dikinase SelD n=1 Tax=Maritimibacter sp. 55A14 TaxID=2174844 RepID=UPI000D61F6E8|nr:selenide, water dikinase SelD [Maritimibacter sp. 55A14]PWE32815.1 selenide, water dikinase SelD [Maritimibacter sp. 55A14]
MQMPLPLTRDLVLIGGGHAHALVLRRWAMNPLAGVRLTLINPDPTAPYSGMLPGHVAGHYSRAALEIDLVKLGRFAGARLVLGRAEGIDRQARRITVPGRADIAYDIASIDIGVTSAMPDLPGFADHAWPAKPLGPFADAWEDFVARAAAGRRPPAVAVIGGGVAGVELSMAMAHRLRQVGCAAPQVHLLEAGPEALRDIGGAARRALLDALARAGVTLHLSSPVTEVTAEGLRLAGGAMLAADFVTGAAGARPQSWLAEIGVATHKGYVTVDETLRSPDDEALFAVGDCAHLGWDARPKAGVFAVREAPVLHDNLRAALSGGRLRAFRPQRDYLKLISTGSKSAVADKFGLRAGGAWLWRLKDRIDRKFMDQFHDLPAMPAPRLPAEVAEGLREALSDGKPLCGGCGAKVGPGDLAEALSRLPPPVRSDVLSGPGDDAAVLAHGADRQVITTDHLRAFTEDPWAMARIAAIHALGDIWAMGAEPQAALVSIVLPRLNPRLQARTLDEIMDAAGAVLAEAGADLVGGHTSLGAELTIGFTLTGLVAGEPVGLGGGRPGDALILTRPLGTGTVLAAEMALAARGDWVAAAMESMMRAGPRAARLLATEARAMTDVTGFGLGGHLLGLCRASGTGARIALDALPLLPGAEELATQGIRSSLWAANAEHGAEIRRPGRPRDDLLFDPQTAGGLLTAVPGDRAETIVERLRGLGEPAACIGKLTGAEEGIVVE